ncbi:MAG: hypothetical protein ACQESG_02815 [Nanobdellota archaeon]
MKKGISISINFIIIAIVAIAVLIVILFIFNDKARIFTSSTSKFCTCPDAQAAAANNCPEGYTTSYRRLQTDCDIESQLSVQNAEETSSDDKEKGDIVECCVEIGDY